MDEIPSLGEVARSSALSVVDWATSNVPKIREKLEKRFSKAPIGKRLHELPPLSIDITETAHKAIKNFKETWNAKRCRAACDTAGMYEASGSMFWFDASCNKPLPHVGLTAHVTWNQLDAARAAWSEEAWLSSHSDETLRRFEFPGVFTSCIDAVPHIDTAPTYQDLPLLVGHSMVWSWY